MELSQMFFKQLPGWLESPASILRYAEGAGGRQTKRPRLAWGVIAAGLAGVALAGHSSSIPALSQLPAGPLLLIHWTALALALLWTSGVVATEQRQGTWEMLKITDCGRQLLIRAKWTAMFHRMRPLIMILVGARLVAIGLALADLTAYQGRHLEFYTSGPVAVSIVELAALFAAALLQVPVLLGFNAALGLLIASAFQRVTVARILCLGLIIVQLGLFSPGEGSLPTVLTTEPDRTASASAPDVFTVLRSGIAGHSDLSQLSLRRILWTRADIEYSALHGVVFLALIVAQAFAAQAVLACARHFVSRPLLV